MESEADKNTSAEAEADAEREVANGEEKKKEKVDIRRYSCEFCGIVRSKRSLITSHIHSAHQVTNYSLTHLFSFFFSVTMVIIT